jgi:hypothetical protein
MLAVVGEAFHQSSGVTATGFSNGHFVLAVPLLLLCSQSASLVVLLSLHALLVLLDSFNLICPKLLLPHKLSLLSLPVASLQLTQCVMHIPTIR